ncbi:MAG: hypothetical protein WC222_04870 [Parachlamydiales bacterium]
MTRISDAPPGSKDSFDFKKNHKKNELVITNSNNVVILKAKTISKKELEKTPEIEENLSSGTSGFKKIHVIDKGGKTRDVYIQLKTLSSPDIKQR